MSFKHKFAWAAFIAAALTLAAMTGCSESAPVSAGLDGALTAITAVGNGETSVTLNGESLVITEAGTYRIGGTISDGQLRIEAGSGDKLVLIFDGVDITCTGSAALYIKQADKVTIELADGSENTLTSKGAFASIDENSIDAALFSKDDLVIEGEGKLTVSASDGNGITSKDDLTVKSGNINVTASGHALECKDTLEINGGSFALESGKDGLHAENNDDESLGIIAISDGQFNITVEGDGIDAQASLTIGGGDLTIVSGGGSPETVTSDNGGFGFKTGGRFSIQTETQTSSDSTSSLKGIKADGTISILGGSFNIDSADDALHSNGNVTIDGGIFTLYSGDDGIHADDTLTINDGTIEIIRSYEGLEGLTLLLNGGNIALTAADDGINAAGGADQSGFGGFFAGREGFGGTGGGTLTINGGTIYVNASGDGVDSNGTLEINGGELYISGPTNSGNGALDYESSGVINGGSVIAVGASGMDQNFGGNSTQPSVSVSFGGSVSGELIVYDASGKKLASFTPEKSYQCAVISLPEFALGETYTINAGGQNVEVTLSSMITGESGGMGGFSGKGGMTGGKDVGGRGTMPEGDMPTMPDGEMPQLPNGGNMPERGEMPDGDMPSGGKRM